VSFPQVEHVFRMRQPTEPHRDYREPRLARRATHPRVLAATRPGGDQSHEPGDQEGQAGEQQCAAPGFADADDQGRERRDRGEGDERVGADDDGTGGRGCFRQRS